MRSLSISSGNPGKTSFVGVVDCNPTIGLAIVEEMGIEKRN